MSKSTQRMKNEGLCGVWVLDPTRSEAPTSHLASLGLGDLAQSAAARISTTVSLRINIRGSELTLVHCSSLGEKERRFQLGDKEPISETGRDGTAIKLSMEQLSPIQLRMHIEYGKARIVETKTLSSPDQLIQETTMTLKGTVSKATRVFMRATTEAAAAAALAAAAAAAAGL